MTTQAHFIPLKKLRGTVAGLRRAPQGKWRYWDGFWRWFFVLTLVAPLLRGIFAPSSSYGQSRRERLAQVIGLPTRLFVRYPLKWFFDWFLVDPCQTPWRLAWERIFAAKNFFWGVYHFLRFIFGLPSRFIKFVAYTSLLRSIIIPYIIEPLFVKSYFSRWKENYYNYCDKHVLGWIPGMAISALGAVISLVPRFLYYFLVKPLTTPWQELYDDAVGVGGKSAFAISYIVKFAIVWPVEYILFKPLFSSMRESWDNEKRYTLLLMTEKKASKQEIFTKKRAVNAKPILIRNFNNKKAYFFAYDGDKWKKFDDGDDDKFSCSIAPRTIQQAWKNNKRQVTITTHDDRKFVGRRIKIFERNNKRWWALAVLKQIMGLPIRIVIRWPLLALEYVLTGPTDLWPWQEEDRDSEKKIKPRRFVDGIFYTGAFLIGWPIIFVRAVLKEIFITPFSDYQLLEEDREPLNFLHYINPVRGIVSLIWRFYCKKDPEEFGESCLEMKVKFFSYTLGAIKIFTSAGMYWLLASLVLAHFFPPVVVLYIGCGIFALANGYVAKKTRFRSIIAKIYLLFIPTTDPRQMEIQTHFRVMVRRGIFVSAIFASVAAGFSGYLGGYSLVAVFGLVGLSGPFAPIALGVLLFLFAAASVTAYLCFQAATAYDNIEKVASEVLRFTITQLAILPSQIDAESSPDFMFYVDGWNRLKCRFICSKTQRIVIKTVSKSDLTSKNEKLSYKDFNEIKEVIKSGGAVSKKYISPYVQKQISRYTIGVKSSPAVQFFKVALPQGSQVQIYVADESDDGGHSQLKCRFTSYKQGVTTDGHITGSQTGSSVNKKNRITEKAISKEDLEVSEKEYKKFISNLKKNKPIDAKMKARIDVYLAELPDGPEINCERNVSFASLFLALFTSTATISFFKTNGALLDSLGNRFGRVGLLAVIIISPDTVIKALTQVLKTSQAIENNRQILEELEGVFKILSSRDPFAILKFFLTGLDTTGDFIITMLTMPPILIAFVVGLPYRIIAYGISLGASIFNWLQSCVFTGKKVCTALGNDSDEEMIQALPKLYRNENPCVIYNPEAGEVYYYGMRKKTVWRRVADFFNFRSKVDVRKRALKFKTKRAIQRYLKKNQGKIAGVENIKKVSDVRISIDISSKNNGFFDDHGNFAGRGDYKKEHGSLDYLVYQAITSRKDNQISLGNALNDASKKDLSKTLIDNNVDRNRKENTAMHFTSNTGVEPNANGSHGLMSCSDVNSKKLERNNSEDIQRNVAKSAPPALCQKGELDIMNCIREQKSDQDDFNFSEIGWINLCLVKAGIKEFTTLSNEQTGLIALLIWIGYIYGVKKVDTDFDKFSMVYDVYRILCAINPVPSAKNNSSVTQSQEIDYRSVLEDGRVAEVGISIRSNNSFSLGKRVSDSYGKFKCSWLLRHDCRSVKEMRTLIKNTANAPKAFLKFFNDNNNLNEDYQRFVASDVNHENYDNDVSYVNVMS